MWVPPPTIDGAADPFSFLLCLFGCGSHFLLWHALTVAIFCYATTLGQPFCDWHLWRFLKIPNVPPGPKRLATPILIWYMSPCTNNPLLPLSLAKSYKRIIDGHQLGMKNGSIQELVNNIPVSLGREKSEVHGHTCSFSCKAGIWRGAILYSKRTEWERE